MDCAKDLEQVWEGGARGSLTMNSDIAQTIRIVLARQRSKGDQRLPLHLPVFSAGSILGKDGYNE
jgi:hypothetical protein